MESTWGWGRLPVELEGWKFQSPSPYPLEKEMAIHSSTLAWKIPLDRGAWYATVHGVAKNWTRLSDFTFLSPYPHMFCHLKEERGWRMSSITNQPCLCNVVSIKTQKHRFGELLNWGRCRPRESTEFLPTFLLSCLPHGCLDVYLFIISQ